MPPRTPRIPGEVIAEDLVTEAIETQSESDLTGDSQNAEETVTVSKASLDALMARVQALESAKPVASSKAAKQTTDLPDAEKVDPDKIKSAVLTKQGWVVPTGYGSNPAAKAL
jgi:hypothetical protein